jgi:hypothetical protein
MALISFSVKVRRHDHIRVHDHAGCPTSRRFCEKWDSTDLEPWRLEGNEAERNRRFVSGTP